MSGPDLFRRENLPQPEAYYIDQGLTLKGSGVERTTLCPFHDDHRPSMRINMETGQYICYACGAGGDLLKFHMDRHGMSFPNAAKDLGAWAGNGQAANSPDVTASRQQWEREQAEAAKKRAEEKAKAQAESANISLRLYQSTPPAPADNPYAVKKGIKPTDTLHEIAVERAAEILGYHPKADDEPLRGRLLIVPVKVGNAISTLEFIDEHGRKSAVWRGNKTGGYWATQKLPDGDGEGLTLLCGEGMATVTSAAASTGHVGIAALTNINLARVAVMLRGRYPKAKIILLSDLGIGQVSAVAAAHEVSGLVAVPPRLEGIKDFNDLHQIKGLAATKAAIEGALPPAPKEEQQQGQHMTVTLARVVNVPTTDGAKILEEVEQFLGRFVAYPSAHARVAHALWIAHAHLIEEWESTPRLAFLSPEPGSGKTRALEITETLVPNPVEAINATPAYIFRRISNPEGLPTILFDEIDTVFGPKAKENEELRGIINAGHRKGAMAGRCVVRGKVVETEELPAYCALAVAGLGALPDTILSRSVIVRMRRRAPGERVEPYRRRSHKPTGEVINKKLAAWSASLEGRLRDAWPEMPTGIEDRNADVWEAMLAVADAAGGKWPKVAREAAVALVADAKQTTPSLGVKLLEDLRGLFYAKDKDGNLLHVRDLIPTEEILKGLAAIEESPWGDMKGKPIDSRRLARYLQQYGAKSKNVRMGDGIVKGYAREDLHDPWQRYLAPSPIATATCATSATTDEEAI